MKKRPPHIQELIDSMPELKELLEHIHPEMEDAVWPLDVDKLTKAKGLLGMLDAMGPSNPDEVTTIGEMNKEGKPMIVLCSRCDSIDESCVVRGSVRKNCSFCNAEVFMSPGTCFSMAQMKDPKICCLDCIEKQVKSEEAAGQ